MSSRHSDGGSSPPPAPDYQDRDKHNSRSGDSDRLRTSESSRGKDRDRRHRDYSDRSSRDYSDRSSRDYSDRSSRNDRARDRSDDTSRSRNRDYTSRRHDYDRDRERHHRHRSRSASPDRSSETSRSRSKSKRTSGFDMGPPSGTTLPGTVGQLPDVSQSVPGMMPNMFPFSSPQVGAFPMMPAHTMTQQATRHARRVYVGGLPPLANEQVEEASNAMTLDWILSCE